MKRTSQRNYWEGRWNPQRDEEAWYQELAEELRKWRMRIKPRVRAANGDGSGERLEDERNIKIPEWMWLPCKQGLTPKTQWGGWYDVLCHLRLKRHKNLIPHCFSKRCWPEAWDILEIHEIFMVWALKRFWPNSPQVLGSITMDLDLTSIHDWLTGFPESHFSSLRGLYSLWSREWRSGKIWCQGPILLGGLG